MSNNEIVEKKFLPPAHQELSTDLDYSRKNLLKLIETLELAVEEMSQIAAQSQSARDYEVLGKLTAQLGDLNEQLVAISDKKKTIGTEAADEKKGNVTNNLFVGSTAELQKMLDSLKKE